MKIHIIRHGQTDWNLSNKIQGKKDIELNENGNMPPETLKNCEIREYTFKD